MLIDRQKMELNKNDIYENVRRDVMRKQTLYSSKNLSGSTPVDTNPKKKKVYTSTTTIMTTTAPECQTTTTRST